MIKFKRALIFGMLCAQPAISNDFKHDFTVGFDTMRYKYEEQTDDNPKFMALRSNQFGVNGAYTFTYNDWLFIQPEAKVNYGFARYSNKWSPQFQASAEPTLLFEARVLSGIHINLLEGLSLSPYTGIGYRHRHENDTLIQSEQNSNKMQCLRINRSWYIPLGLAVKYDFADKWFLSARGEYDFYLGGKHYDYQRNMAPSPILFKQTKGYGIKGEFLVGHHFEKTTLTIGPYFNYWKVDDTKKIEYTLYHRTQRGNLHFGKVDSYEPRNTTMEVGVKFNLTF